VARNTASAYGRSLRCISDADPLFSSVEGLDLVKQDAIHRLANDSVLGPGGDGWGYDCMQLVGLPDSDLAARQPFIAEVLKQDPRIEEAEVALTTVRAGPVADVRIAAICYTAEGPFELVKSVLELSAADIEGQA
jgi:hypothetical protein